MTTQSMRYVTRTHQVSLNVKLRAFMKAQGIEKTGGFQIILKACVLITIYLGLYILCFFIPLSWWMIVPFATLSGFAKAFVGTGVMHDAAHGSFSKHSWVNNLFAHVLYVLGGYLPNWKMQHNVIHHSFTNVHEHDDDIDTRGLIRLSVHQPRKSMYRFQHIYAWFTYALMTLLWITTKDFFQAVRYHKAGKPGYENIRKHLALVTLSKLGYYTVWLLVPMFVWDASVLQVVVWFLCMEFVAGFTLGVIFQPAHIFEKSLNLEAPVAEDFVSHQIRTSCDFATNSRVLTWLFGGLNHQTTHHLFPSVSHVHYVLITKELLPKICEEAGVSYNNAGSFVDALRGHARALKRLGREEE